MRNRRQVSTRLALAAAFAAALVALVPSRPGHADVPPGANYVGTHSGGGSITFTLAADGQTLDRFEATRVPGILKGRHAPPGGVPCSLSLEWSWANPDYAPRIDGSTLSHASGTSSLVALSGAFMGDGSAVGSARIRESDSAGGSFVSVACEVDVEVTWTAGSSG